MNLDFFKPKAPPLFGLDISSSSVKMLEIVDAGKGGYRVERYVIEALPKDAVVDGNIVTIPAWRKALADWSFSGGPSVQQPWSMELQSPPVIQRMAGCFCRSLGSGVR